MAPWVPHCEYSIILYVVCWDVRRAKMPQYFTLNKIATIFTNHISIGLSEEIVYSFNLLNFVPDGLIANKLASVHIKDQLPESV